MQKLLHSYLSASRKHRARITNVALWLLRLIRNVEKDDLDRYSDKLYELEIESVFTSMSIYSALEEEHSNCEHILSYLDSAIEELEYAYS